MSRIENENIHCYIKSMETGVSVDSLMGNNMSRSHTHSGYELYYLIEGNRRLLIKNNFYKMQKGDMLLIAPGILHKMLDEHPPEYKRMVINFPAKLLDDVVGETGVCKNLLEKEAIIVRNEHVSEVALKAISELEIIAQNEENVSGQFEFILLSVLYRFIYFLTSCENILPDTKVYEKKSELISDILEYINQHYTGSITLTELSSRFYMSEYHLCRCFKKSTGRTIVEYINYLRVEKAKQMLTESSKSIQTVAKMCGFKTTAHFNHVFKEYEKTSPSQFLKSRK